MGSSALRTFAEMKEFATFSPAAQRYIRRSLDVASGRDDVMAVWARNAQEVEDIRLQARSYSRLSDIRAVVPEDADIGTAEVLLSILIPVTTFDLMQGRIVTFGAYRFLYERLLGTRVRPWLPAAFLSAAALPSIHPDQRRRLLTSVSEAAATASGWSTRDVGFFPTWVDKVEVEAA